MMFTEVALVIHRPLPSNNCVLITYATLSSVSNLLCHFTNALLQLNDAEKEIIQRKEINTEAN